MTEMAQIQGFDAPLQFPTHWKANKQQELIGNAVPPPVAKAVLLQVRVFLQTCVARVALCAVRRISDPTLVCLRPHVVASLFHGLASSTELITAWVP